MLCAGLCSTSQQGGVACLVLSCGRFHHVSYDMHVTVFFQPRGSFHFGATSHSLKTKPNEIRAPNDHPHKFLVFTPLVLTGPSKPGFQKPIKHFVAPLSPMCLFFRNLRTQYAHRNPPVVRNRAPNPLRNRPLSAPRDCISLAGSASALAPGDEHSRAALEREADGH